MIKIITTYLLLTWFASNTTVFAQENPCPQSLRERPYNQSIGRGMSTAVMSLPQAKRYFNEIKNRKYGIPYDYVIDGCDVRAVLISKNLLERFNISTFRVALEASGDPLVRYTPQTAEGVVEFSRHTAPAVCALNPETNRVEPYIFDPSFFSGPIPYAEWVRGFTNNGQIRAKSYLGNMFSLDPRSGRTQFSNAELREVERLRSVYLDEVKRMTRKKEKPYGLGQSRGSYPSDYAGSTTGISGIE